ncbi:MAG: aldo/keto reductase [Peptococcaceae bacterium]|nr:aldo/keto reductase [Peptococcaceae bacterium]
MNVMREIGQSGIAVPFLGLGTWAIGGGSWWGDNDDALSIRAIHEAIDRGIVWVDTAPIYGRYHSENVVGQALKGKRDKVVLSTKCGLEWRHGTPIFHKTVDGTDVYRDLSPASIREDVEASLRRLGTDYIDVIYTHWQSPDQNLYPIAETMDALETLKREGKLRAIGASNVTPEHIRAYTAAGQLDVIQEKYSLFTRRIEKALVPVCQELGISIQAYSPLEQGLFTGKARMDTVLAPGDVRNGNPCWQPAIRAQGIAFVEALAPFCEKYHCSPAALVIVLTSQMIDGLHVLCGARKPAQVEDNASALTLAIDPADLAQMRALLPDLTDQL